MNGRYALADTPEDRISLAVVASIHAYFQQHPNGVLPGQTFLSQFLKPFVEREALEVELRILQGRTAHREREILQNLARLRAECEKRANHEP